MNKATVTILIVLFILAFGIVIVRSQQQNSPSVTTTSPTQTEKTAQGDTIETVSTDDRGTVKRYTAPDLGITFTYLTSPEDGGNWFIKRTNNRVCITYDETDEECAKGQYVEVFTKDPAVSLIDAIEMQFLADIPDDECFVKDYAQPYDDPNAVNYAEISFPEVTDPNDPWFEANASKCPENYRRTNGIRYFMEDPNVPDKYVYFSIGQFAIPGGQEGTGWQQNLQVLP